MKGRRQTRIELSDDALRTMLLARARRADTRGLLGEIGTMAVGVPQRRGLAMLLAASRRVLPRLSAAVATVAVVALVVGGLLMSGTLGPSGPASSGPPSPVASPSASSPPGSVPPGPDAVPAVQPLTVGQLSQLSQLLKGGAAAVTGRELIVSGRLEAVPATCQDGSSACSDVILVGSTLTIQPIADLGAANWPTVGHPIDGTFAMTVGTATLEYRGTVSAAPDGGPWTPGTMPVAVAGRAAATDFVLVHGWLGAAGTTCPYQTPVPSGQLDYSCGHHSWITATPWPVAGNLPPQDPATGVWVQNTAYDDFAVDPVGAGSMTTPREGTYLVRWTYVNPCPTANGVILDCFIPPTAWHWELDHRIDPWPDASAVQTPVAGGCGSTQVFAGPGPDAGLGLADNPWAPANPADSGIVAYFWYPPPDVLFALRDPNDPNSGNTKILWVFRGQQADHLVIAAHPLDATSPVVRFEFPASGSQAPSGIGLPSPGCWRLELTLGTTHATMDVLVAPAQP